MKTLITGARGQLGAELGRKLAAGSFVALDRSALDVTDAAAVAARIDEHRPDVVVNAAAYNQVDLAEDEPEAAFRANALAPLFLARSCRRSGALLVHFSTDYVFGGPAADVRREDDAPRPESVYAVSKLAGEELVRGATALHLILRTSGLYGLHGSGGKGGNFVETMFRLAAAGKTLRVVDDQVLTPTFAADLADKTVELVDRWRRERSPDLLGLHHVTNAGACSWFEFAAEIFRQSGLAVDLRPTSTAAYGARAKRPARSVLARDHLARLGMDDLRDWRAALAAYLAERAALNRRSET